MAERSSRRSREGKQLGHWHGGEVHETRDEKRVDKEGDNFNWNEVFAWISWKKGNNGAEE